MEGSKIFASIGMVVNKGADPELPIDERSLYHREGQYDVAIRLGESSRAQRGISSFLARDLRGDCHDSFAVSQRLRRIATRPRSARNDATINNFPFLSVILGSSPALGRKAGFGYTLKSVCDKEDRRGQALRIPE
jgi:hypothetical protein